MVLAGSLIVLAPAISQAEIVGDQHWVTPINSSPTFHSMSFQDELPVSATFPHLTAEHYTSSPTIWDRYLCSSTADAHCQNVSQFSYESIFPICKIATDLDCIEGVNAISSSGKIENGKFLSYTVPDHVNKFPPDPVLGIPKTETPSLWDIPSAPHTFGTQYALVVGQMGSVKMGDYGNSTQSQLYTYLLPVSKIDVGHPRNDSPLKVSYDSLWEAPKNALGRTNTQGDGSSTDACTMSLAENGKCLTSHAFPEGFKYSVKIRLSKEPVSWLHGRLVDPSISIASSNGSVELSVTASPTKVPVLWVGVDSSKLSAEQEALWVSCFNDGTVCSGGGTQDGRAMDFSRPFDAAYSKTLNLWATMYEYGPTAIKSIQLLSPLVDDKSQALPSAWSFHTLPTTQLENADGCFANGGGLKGIVTTNSTAYSEGPPTFKNGSLQYTVASTHYNPDGSVFKGTYNLVMRSDVARCLYKFTSAPIKASISVVSADGSNDVATTVSNETGGWLYLSANNFTFSTPTVQIKLSQDASVATPAATESPTPAPVATKAPAVAKKITITCIKGKSTKIVTAVKPTCPTGYKRK
jgi:hypothetical protein